MGDLQRLHDQFDEAMLSVYKRAKVEAKYTPTKFLGMLNTNGGLMTAKKLINAPEQSDGYTRLYELGRLDLTVEAVVLADSRWHQLFTSEELDRCRVRLMQNGYTIPS